jgi:hypothetical protein
MGCCIATYLFRGTAVPGNLDPDEWAILRRVIDLIQVNDMAAS